MNEVFQSPFFGIALSILTFEIGVWIESKVRWPIANPLLIAILLCIGILLAFDIPLSSYNRGGEVISAFLGPATAVLALSIYSQWKRFKVAFLPILVGTVVGSIVSVTSAYFLCQAFGLDLTMTRSLLVKSVSTPFAMAISKSIGGIPSVSVAAVVLTGILGAVSAPALIRVFRLRDPVAIGVAIGTSSHAVGTSKAISLGEVEGAMSGIALGLSGLVTVLISLWF